MFELEHHVTAQYTSRKSSLHHPLVGDSLTESDKEEQIISWLGTHGVPDSWKLAQSLVAL